LKRKMLMRNETGGERGEEGRVEEGGSAERWGFIIIHRESPKGKKLKKKSKAPTKGKDFPVREKKKKEAPSPN